MSFDDQLTHKKLRVLSDVADKKSPSDDYSFPMLEYAEFVSAGACGNKDCLLAFRLHDDLLQREILEALLLVDCSVEDIKNVFGVPESVIEVYREMFFDASNTFQTKLDKISYATEAVAVQKGKNLKLMVLNLGPESVLYTYGALIPSASAQRALVQKMFLSSAYKAMTMHFNGIESPAAKQSIEFAKIMMKAYESLEKYAPQDTASDAEMHQYLLKTVDTYASGTNTPAVNTEDIV